MKQLITRNGLNVVIIGAVETNSGLMLKAEASNGTYITYDLGGHHISHEEKHPLDIVNFESDHLDI